MNGQNQRRLHVNRLHLLRLNFVFFKLIHFAVLHEGSTFNARRSSIFFLRYLLIKGFIFSENRSLKLVVKKKH